MNGLCQYLYNITKVKTKYKKYIKFLFTQKLKTKRRQFLDEQQDEESIKPLQWNVSPRIFQILLTLSLVRNEHTIIDNILIYIYIYI